MKKYLLTFFTLLLPRLVLACKECTTSLPRGLRGEMQHPTGPDSNWDYLIVGATIVIVLLTMFYSVKWLLNPGEKESTHIKSLILIPE